MALTHLIDTSVVKRLRDPSVRNVIEPLAIVGSLARPTIVDLEVGFSARNTTEWDALIAALDGFAPLPTTAANMRRALQTQRLLAARSQCGRKIPDLLIAAVAEEHDLSVLHYDTDYDLIAAATGQRTEWVVPAGTID